MSPAKDPRGIALAAHRDYYAAGSYDDDRLTWTIHEFLSGAKPTKMLEIGCGGGAMLRLLIARGINARGVDASSSGMERCITAGLQAEFVDVIVDGLTFTHDVFDMILKLGPCRR